MTRDRPARISCNFVTCSTHNSVWIFALQYFALKVATSFHSGNPRFSCAQFPGWPPSSFHLCSLPRGQSEGRGVAAVELRWLLSSLAISLSLSTESPAQLSKTPASSAHRWLCSFLLPDFPHVFPSQWSHFLSSNLSSSNPQKTEWPLSFVSVSYLFSLYTGKVS